MITWNRCVCIGVLLLCLAMTERTSVASSGEAVPVIEIDAVWAEFDGIRHEIFYASRQAGKWSDPEMVTDDYFDNQLPVIDRDSQGRAWLAWTAYDRQMTEIRVTSGLPGAWQQNAPVAAAMTTNTSPSLVIDESDVVWLVWSANSGGLDDIYYAAYQNGAWSEPALVHAENDRADVLPTITLNDNGRPVIWWKALVGGEYVDVFSEYTNGAWLDEQAVDKPEVPAADEGDEEVILPEFIVNIDTLFLRMYR